MKTLNFFKISLTLVSILFSSFCCKDDNDLLSDDEQPVVVVNQTDEIILVHAARSEESGLKWLFSFEDKTKFISPGEAEIVDSYIFLSITSYPHTPYILYVIKGSTLDKYTINEIFECNIYDDKLIFSFDDLLELNFKINYK